MRDYHLSSHAFGKVKTNRPHASQLCICVIIVQYTLVVFFFSKKWNKILKLAINNLLKRYKKKKKIAPDQAAPLGAGWSGATLF